MVICPECGTYVKEDSMFCYNCGRPVKDDWCKVADDVVEHQTFGISLSDKDTDFETNWQMQGKEPHLELSKTLELLIENPAIPEDVKINTIIHTTALMCAIIAVQPLPFADVLILTPIQVGMVTAMSRVMDNPLSDSGAKEVIAHVLGVVGWGVLAQHAILGLYKAGLPYVAGVTTIPLVYAATVGLGYAAKAVLDARRNDQTITREEIKKIRKEAEEKARSEKRDWTPKGLKEDFEKKKAEVFEYQEYKDTLHANQVADLKSRIEELSESEELYRTQAEKALNEKNVLEQKLKSSVDEEEYLALYEQKERLEKEADEVNRKLCESEQEKVRLQEERERRIAKSSKAIKDRYERLYPSVRVRSESIYKRLAGMTDEENLAIEKQIGRLQYNPDSASWRSTIQGTNVRELGCGYDLRLYVSLGESGYVIEEVGPKSTQDSDIRRLKDRCST